MPLYPEVPAALRARWVTHDDALEQLGMHRNTFRAKRKLGLFDCRLHNRCLIVKQADIDRYLRNLPKA